jgi:PDZ domain-containing protein
MSMKRLAGFAVALGLVGLVTAFALWILPADEFIFTPGNPKPLDDKVVVEGGRPTGKGDVYYVDIFVRRTTRLEELFPGLRPEGSTVVPEHVLLPPGTSEAERDRQTAAEMAYSELIASAVALRELGYDVRATPRGALVIEVAQDVPASDELERGDVIVAVDETPVRTPDDLRREIGRLQPGDDASLTIRRDGNRVGVVVRTVADTREPERPILGIFVDQDADISLPLDVDIDLGQVGGPSAGLPFAIEIARLLGRNVTHGCDVAATGELALDGTVRSVGGLKQKTIAARDTGVDLFLVPSGENAEVAQENAEDLEIVPVDSFQQALRLLTTSRRKC